MVTTVVKEREKGSALHEMVKTILVPTDLSSVTKSALRFALALAERAEARVLVATVVGKVEGDVYSPIRYSPEASARQEDVVEMLRENLTSLVAAEKREGLSVEITVKKGRPVATIVGLAEKENVDLIVMGTHGRTGLDHFVVGSATEELVRRAPCSVLTLHGDEERLPADIKRILVPVDLSDYSPGLLEYAFALAREVDAAVDVLHIIEPIPLLDVFSGAMTMRDMVPDIQRRSSAALEKLLDQVETEGVTMKVHAFEGHAAKKILDFASAKNSDLIVIGTQGKSAIERFFMGSVAERVVRLSTCPVLAARLAVERN